MQASRRSRYFRTIATTVAFLLASTLSLATGAAFAQSQTYNLAPSDELTITCNTTLTSSVVNGQTVFTCAAGTVTGPDVTELRGVSAGQSLSGKVAIEAIVSGQNVSNVTFQLNGPKPASHQEKFAPYFFFGDDQGEPRGWDTTQYPNGDYTLTATAIDTAGQRDALTVAFKVANQAVPQPAPANGGTMTITPAEIPLNEPEIVNPFRGLTRWGNGETAPQPRPSFDDYARFEWRTLEPQQDSYDFSAIDARCNEAKKVPGRKFSFRVRAVAGPNSGVKVPDYLMKLMNGSNSSDGRYVPDWNDADFLSRARKLVLKLGERYDKNPCIGYVDIGMYGAYGEWNLYKLSGSPATEASLRAMVDMHTDAFPTKRLLMLTDNTYGVQYALGKSPRIGIRRDSLGNDHFAAITKDARWQAIQERWKTAPFVSEFMGGGNWNMALAREQVGSFHVAMIGNGNLSKSWSQLNSSDQGHMQSLGKESGYRFVLNNLTTPEVLRAGGAFTLSAEWSNRGITPAYERWNVGYELRDSSGKTVWSGVSSLNLEQLLPTKQPTSVGDTFSLPADLAAGSYDLVLMIRDPENYRLPLALAIRGAAQDGSYKLATLSVER